MSTQSITVTIPNPTKTQMTALAAILASTSATTANLGEIALRAKRGGSSKTSKSPAKTVSPDEDEDYGNEALDEDDVMEAGSDDPADFDDEDEADEEEEPGVSFADLKASITKYGEKSPKDMKAIYAGFNVKTIQELKTKPAKWEAVYSKVQAKLKALKSKR